MNSKLEHALLYASAGWSVFSVSGFKIPFKGSNGHKDASSDPDVVRAMWERRPHANLALATGPIVCIDLDGTAWSQSPWGASLAAAAQANGGMPATLMQRTSGGLHLLFTAPPGVEIRSRNEPRAKRAPGVDIKGHGGFIVLAPSVNAKTGFVYKFVNSLPPATMPDWLIAWCQAVGNADRIIRPADLGLGQVPSYLKQKYVEYQERVAERSEPKPTWSADEEMRLRAALQAIPAEGYDTWRQVGMALWWLDWVRSDGTSIAFELFDEWSQTCDDKYSLAATETKWASFERNARGDVTIGSLYHLAKQHGWNGQAAVAEVDLKVNSTFPQTINGTHINGLNGHATKLPKELQLAPASIRFMDTTEDGFPKPTMMNTSQAIEGLRISCRKDLFHNRTELEGYLIQDFAKEIQDDTLLLVRSKIRMVYGFDPGEINTRQAAETLAIQHRYDPLLDYLDTLQWDGKPRLDTWLTQYLRAQDTALNRAIGRIVLIAAVRRAREPGTKFDQIIVLEAPEGVGKSTAISILAGPGYFSDQHVLGLNSERQQEAISGVWLYEIADLTGMRRSDIEHVKAFLSRQEDRARAAYAHYRSDNKRRCIFFATTNEDSYLKSDTGNRRFWPIQVGETDIGALREDRNQLWAEAVEMERRGVSITLDRKLWKDAGEEQDKRLEREPWVEMIGKYVDGKERRDDVGLSDVLVANPHLAMPAAQVNQVALNRAAKALKQLGFTKYRRREGAALAWRYRRFGAAQVTV